jgi:hypothetical protein
MIYPGEGKKGKPKAGDYVLAASRDATEEFTMLRGLCPTWQ